MTRSLRPPLGDHAQTHDLRRIAPGDLHYTSDDLVAGVVTVSCRLEDSIILSVALQSDNPVVRDMLRRLAVAVMLAHGEDVVEWEREKRGFLAVLR